VHCRLKPVNEISPDVIETIERGHFVGYLGLRHRWLSAGL
jgi:hypothetical protein